MSDCLHCDIHELLESELQGKEANLVEITAKVTEVLADLILMAPVDDQSKLMADILANLGSFVLEKNNLPTQLIRAVHTISGFDVARSDAACLPPCHLDLQSRHHKRLPDAEFTVP